MQAFIIASIYLAGFLGSLAGNVERNPQFFILREFGVRFLRPSSAISQTQWSGPSLTRRSGLPVFVRSRRAEGRPLWLSPHAAFQSCRIHDFELVEPGFGAKGDRRKGVHIDVLMIECLMGLLRRELPLVPGDAPGTEVWRGLKGLQSPVGFFTRCVHGVNPSCMA